jgi:glycosyltransferase involved in cell wall biosynthesis
VPAYFSAFGIKGLYAATDFLNARALDISSKVYHYDIFHFTNPTDYRKHSGKKTIVTFHDLSSYKWDGWTKEHTTKKIRERVDEICAATDRFIAVSQFTKDDLVATLHLDPEKIDVVYEGVSDDFYPDKEFTETAKKYGIRGDYILYVGQLQERKNVLGLMRSYAALSRDIRATCQLVLRGTFRDEAFRGKLMDLAIELGIQDNLICIDSGVPIGDLRKLYSNALFFTYPSFFEGFGLPVAEALKCGAPVIASNTSSLPEVGGSAAVYVDPENLDAITAAMSDLFSDKEKRNAMRERGLSEVRKFDWKRAAEETVKIYSRALNG